MLEDMKKKPKGQRYIDVPLFKWTCNDKWGYIAATMNGEKELQQKWKFFLSRVLLWGLCFVLFVCFLLVCNYSVLLAIISTKLVGLASKIKQSIVNSFFSCIVNDVCKTVKALNTNNNDIIIIIIIIITIISIISIKYYYY